MNANKPASKNTKEKKKKKTKNPAMGKSIINMLGGFTVLRFTSMLGMHNIYFSKKELLKINAKLNKIRRPNK